MKPRIPNCQISNLPHRSRPLPNKNDNVNRWLLHIQQEDELEESYAGSSSSLDIDCNDDSALYGRPPRIEQVCIQSQYFSIVAFMFSKLYNGVFRRTSRSACAHICTPICHYPFAHKFAFAFLSPTWKWKFMISRCIQRLQGLLSPVCSLICHATFQVLLAAPTLHGEVNSEFYCADHASPQPLGYLMLARSEFSSPEHTHKANLTLSQSSLLLLFFLYHTFSSS